MKFKMPETLASGVFEAHRCVDFSILFTIIFRFNPDSKSAMPRQPNHHSIHDDVEDSDE